MLNQFFVSHLPSSGEVIVDGDEAHHALKVLRIKEGERIRLSDGAKSFAEVEVITIGKSQFTCSIKSYGEVAPSRIQLTVVQALPKSDRIKETLELLTEGGVSEIIPWQAERSIAQWQSDSESKWNSAVREASKQSRRVVIPRVSPRKNSRDVMTALTDADCVLVFHESETQPLSHVLEKISTKNISRLALIIGPEGGISERELAEFLAGGAIAVRMGEPIFRAAHAGVAALAAVQTGLRLW
jgi:16S rRNA (uracil1498-N3)-methyltransferase